MSKHFLFLFLLLPFWGIAQEGVSVEKETQVKNMITFAKLYGYVKYFYPGDEAVKINWDKFAIAGVEEIRQAENQNQLKEKLETLFFCLLHPDY